jgi:hypothetical protein
LKTTILSASTPGSLTGGTIAGERKRHAVDFGLVVLLVVVVFSTGGV